MLSAMRLNHYLAFLRCSDRIPPAMLLDAVNAVGGFYHGTCNPNALCALRKIVELEKAEYSTRLLAYVYMLGVGSIPIDEYPPNIMEVDLVAVRNGRVYKHLCSMASQSWIRRISKTMKTGALFCVKACCGAHLPETKPTT